MDYVLKSAQKEHFNTVLAWIQSAEQLQLWGGAALSFPPTVETTWVEIGANADNSFVLCSCDDVVVGFAQTLVRASNIHLARIIVSPAVRGKGLGRILCEKLIQRVCLEHHPERITLNVFSHNTVAIGLYTALGFAVTSTQTDMGLIGMTLSSPNLIQFETVKP